LYYKSLVVAPAAELGAATADAADSVEAIA
jgi:hypothetical protein